MLEVDGVAIRTSKQPAWQARRIVSRLSFPVQDEMRHDLCGGADRVSNFILRQDFCVDWQRRLGLGDQAVAGG
jgi:hypothetical protein